MKQTKNYGLHKADPDEYYDINIMNENLDKIDEKMGEQSEAINKKGDCIKYDPITKKMKLMRGNILLSEAKISDATKKNAGIVKPADGLTVEEDGTLKVNIDGTTLTMDQVNNVIKLADTLKDAINGAFPAANVANNQITTVEGFALDARQANPNLDGTLAKQISDLNGSLYGVTSNIFSIVTSDSIEFQLFHETKIGNLIVLQCTFHVKQNIASWQNLNFSQYSNENIRMLGGMFQSQNTNKAYVVVDSPGKYVAIRTDNSGIGNDDWLRGFAILCITSTK